MSRTTLRDELRATAEGETRRARERSHELASIMAALSESVRDSLESTDPAIVAVRLQTVVLGAVVVLNELGGVAGRLAALGAVGREI